MQRVYAACAVTDGSNQKSARAGDVTHKAERCGWSASLVSISIQELQLRYGCDAAGRAGGTCATGPIMLTGTELRPARFHFSIWFESFSRHLLPFLSWTYTEYTQKCVSIVLFIQLYLSHLKNRLHSRTCKYILHISFFFFFLRQFVPIWGKFLILDAEICIWCLMWVLRGEFGTEEVIYWLCSVWNPRLVIRTTPLILVGDVCGAGQLFSANFPFMSAQWSGEGSLCR